MEPVLSAKLVCKEIWQENFCNAYAKRLIALRMEGNVFYTAAGDIADFCNHF